jgi:hypothetical protein
VLGLWCWRPRSTGSRDPLVVYTAIFGGIPDRLRPPRGFRAAAGVQYVCFTDREHSTAGEEPWEMRPAVWTHVDPRRTARYHKILSHVVFPDAESTLWLDGNIRLRASPWSVLDRHLANGFDIAAFKHRHRGDVYEELEACIRLSKDEPEMMKAQVARYHAAGYPGRNGLAETGVLARRHTEAVRKFNETWWSEIERGSVRDQLSFPYSLWTQGLAFALLEGQPDRSPYVIYERHR